MSISLQPLRESSTKRFFFFYEQYFLSKYALFFIIDRFFFVILLWPVGAHLLVWPVKVLVVFFMVCSLPIVPIAVGFFSVNFRKMYHMP